MPKLLLTTFICLLFAVGLHAQPQMQNKVWCSCQLVDSKKVTNETLVLNSAVSPHLYVWGTHHGTYALTGVNEISFREEGTGVTKTYYTNMFDNGNYLTLVENTVTGEKVIIHFVLCSSFLK